MLRAHLSLAAIALSACSPSILNGSSGGLYRLDPAPVSACAQPVRLLDRSHADPSSYRVLAEVSVLCPWLSPQTCEQRLLERGCQLGADAIVLQDNAIVGGRSRPQTRSDALAVHFDARSATN